MPYFMSSEQRKEHKTGTLDGKPRFEEMSRWRNSQRRAPKVLERNSILTGVLVAILTIPCAQTRAQTTSAQERQRQAQEEQDRQRQAREEQQAEQDRQRQAREEQQAELDRQHQAELDRQRQAELDRQRQAELDRQRQAELDRQHQPELGSKRQPEHEPIPMNHEIRAAGNSSIVSSTPRATGQEPASTPAVVPAIPSYGVAIAPNPASAVTTNMLVNALATPATQASQLGADAATANQQNLMFQSWISSQALQQQQLSSGFDQILMTIIQNTSDPTLASALAGQIGQTDPIQKALADQLNAMGSISQNSADQKSKLASQASALAGRGGQTASAQQALTNQLLQSSPVQVSNPSGSNGSPGNAIASVSETCPNMQPYPDEGFHCNPVRDQNQCVKIQSSTWGGGSSTGIGELTVVFVNICSQSIRISTIGSDNDPGELQMLAGGQVYTFGHSQRDSRYQYNADDGTDCFVNNNRPGCNQLGPH